MIFIARLLQEKCREQHCDLYMAFIDLTKALDTVNRELLWDALAKFGCPPQVLAVLRAFHDGMMAKVVLGGSESAPFHVNIGVKQGCVLAPVIFNLFLVAVTLAFRNDCFLSDAIGINFRLDGSLFNLRRLQAPTKCSTDHVFELQYADDASVPSHTAAGLQRNLDNMHAAYYRAGLVINTKKTEVLSQLVSSHSVTTTFTVAGDPPPARHFSLHIPRKYPDERLRSFRRNPTAHKACFICIWPTLQPSISQSQSVSTYQNGGIQRYLHRNSTIQL